MRKDISSPIMIEDDLEEGVDRNEFMKVIEDPRMNFLEEEAMIVGEKKEEEGKRDYHINIVLVSFSCSDGTKGCGSKITCQFAKG